MEISLQSGVEILQQQRNLKMWTTLEDAWYATQSFYLLRIMSETSLMGETSHARHTIMDSVDYIPLIKFTSNPRFGYTMDASNILMSCISEINTYSQRGWTFGQDKSIDGFLASVLERLEKSRKSAALGLSPSHDLNDDVHSDVPRSPAKQAHLRAYTAAACIYFYHEFYDLPPRDMAPYLSEVLNSILTFAQLSGRNYMLWPVFIAAVEAYEENDTLKLQELLTNACGVGMANRVKIKSKILWSGSGNAVKSRH
jgi:hypothetical protein